LKTVLSYQLIILTYLWEPFDWFLFVFVCFVWWAFFFLLIN